MVNVEQIQEKLKCAIFSLVIWVQKHKNSDISGYELNINLIFVFTLQVLSQ